MKFIERFALRLFSIIIILICVFIMLLMFDFVPLTVIPKAILLLMEGTYPFRIAMIVFAILILLSIRCLFARLKPVDEAKNGIVLENASGKLIISKESLENLISSVSKNIPGAEAISSKTVLDKDRNLKVYVTTVVSGDVMLKEISTELQRRIKDAMKKTADLDVKEVNIKIKNITNRKSKSKVEDVDNTTNTSENDNTIETNEEVNKEIDNGEE